MAISINVIDNQTNRWCLVYGQDHKTSPQALAEALWGTRIVDFFKLWPTKLRV